MRYTFPAGKTYFVIGACAGLALIIPSCRQGDSRRDAATDGSVRPGKTGSGAAAAAPTSTTASKTTKTSPSKRTAITAENNPTTAAGRGAPDLEDQNRPAAWIYVDGHEGKFKEEGGHPLLQWFIDKPTSSTPTFRVEAYEPVIGEAKDFKAVLRTVESADGSDLVYGIASYDGTFELGREYSLLNPGESFIVRNGATGDIIKEIAPLAPGTYAIAAGVRNAATNKQTLAVTYFTVEAEK